MADSTPSWSVDPDAAANPAAGVEAPNLGTGVAVPTVDPFSKSAQQPQGPPQMGRMPLLAQFIKDMAVGPRGTIQPGDSQPTRPPSRLDAFEGFVGNFLNAFSQGMSNAGTGPAANARGFGAAVQAPYRTALQQYQTGQQAQAQQAAIQEQQARARLTQAQAEQMANVVQTPYGPMSQALAAKVFPAAIAAQGRTEAAKIGGESRVDVAKINQGALANVPQELQDKYGVPAQLPIAKVRALMSAEGGQYQIVQGANDQYLLSKVDKTKSALGVGNPRVAAAQARPVEVTDFDADGKPYTHFMPYSDAIARNLSSATQGGKNLSRTAQINDIEQASKNMRSSIANLDRGFSPAQIAKLTVAMSSNDEGVVQTQMQALANESLTEKQQDFVIWAKHLNERAMSLRNIAGMGQGAQDLRGAIRSLLPGAQTGDPKLMNKYLDAFDQQVKILKGGIPKPGGAPPSQDKGSAMDRLNKRYLPQ